MSDAVALVCVLLFGVGAVVAAYVVGYIGALLLYVLVCSLRYIARKTSGNLPNNTNAQGNPTQYSEYIKEHIHSFQEQYCCLKCLSVGRRFLNGGADSHLVERHQGTSHDGPDHGAPQVVNQETDKRLDRSNHRTPTLSTKREDIMRRTVGTAESLWPIVEGFVLGALLSTILAAWGAMQLDAKVTCVALAALVSFAVAWSEKNAYEGDYSTNDNPADVLIAEPSDECYRRADQSYAKRNPLHISPLSVPLKVCARVYRLARAVSTVMQKNR